MAFGRKPKGDDEIPAPEPTAAQLQAPEPTPEVAPELDESELTPAQAIAARIIYTHDDEW